MILKQYQNQYGYKQKKSVVLNEIATFEYKIFMDNSLLIIQQFEELTLLCNSYLELLAY